MSSLRLSAAPPLPASSPSSAAAVVVSANDASSSQSKVLSREEWERRLAEVRVSKNEMNRLVMNYLVIEGYKDAAESFAKESGIVSSEDLSSIQQRMAIRQSVQAGRIEEAVEQVNDLDPQILDSNRLLYFHLQQQRLIELIRARDIAQALAFAQEELAPRGEESPEFLEELEKTMALLAFEDTKLSPISGLLDHAQRQKVASELNASILASQQQAQDPKLPSLLKMLVWSQNALAERVAFPQITDFAAAALQDPEVTMGNLGGEK